MSNSGRGNATFPSIWMVPPSESDGHMIVARDLLKGVHALSTLSDCSRSCSLLAGQALECALKAYLWHKGKRNNLDRHDLKDLWDRAYKEKDLSITEIPPDWVTTLSEGHGPKFYFRYQMGEKRTIVNGGKTPALIPMESELRGLIEKVERFLKEKTIYSIETVQQPQHNLNIRKNIISAITNLGKIRHALVQTESINQIVMDINSSKQPLSLEDNNCLNTIPKAKGLYVFYAKFPFTKKEELFQFGENWGFKNDKKALENCPRFHKSHSGNKKNIKLLWENKFIPFYLGKSGNLHTRIKYHINAALDKTAYGLKLKERKDDVTGIEFQLGFIEFEIPDEFYFCIELLEKEVKIVLKPIIGK